MYGVMLVAMIKLVVSFNNNYWYFMVESDSCHLLLIIYCYNFFISKPDLPIFVASLNFDCRKVVVLSTIGPGA